MSNRLTSIDFMRGFIMFLLAAESTMLYERLHHLTGDYGLMGHLITQFFHHEWHGLRFWDLMQPSFMTIAGTSLYLSTKNRLEKGHSYSGLWKHTLIRSLKLLACGVALHCVYAGTMVWELWNVLSQLSVTLIIAFALLRQPISVQLSVSFGLILLTDFLYRFTSIEGFNQPFTPDHNFGSWMDWVLMGKINEGHWIAINCIPTAAHTIWGAVAGRLLVADKPSAYKIKVLVIAGLLGLILGYGLDWTNLSPIIKRICTASFVLVSGGWVFLMMAFCYWFIDVRKTGNWIQFFIIIGTNAIFIYLLFETLGMQWLNKAVAIFANGATGLLGLSEPMQLVIASICTLLVEWYLCYWLYTKRIFIKL